jgi:hypothetical protein
MNDEPNHEGIDFALERLCAFLGVDPAAVTWDAATETVDGDVSAVIGNIMRAKYGEDFDPKAGVAATPASEPVVDSGPTWQEQAHENGAEAAKMVQLIKDGVHCDFDDAMVTLFVSDESDPSVGLYGGVYLSMSCNYEVVPVSLLNNIKSAMGDNWERCVDLWRQTYGDVR